MVIDFGSRRLHGTDAAIKIARATYLAGGDGTSNVLAGQIYEIPVFGTMAHSYIQAHDEESGALEAFAALYPDTTLLVDTYDTPDVKYKIEYELAICVQYRPEPDAFMEVCTLNDWLVTEVSDVFKIVFDAL